jgi:hypothetical protein
MEKTNIAINYLLRISALAQEVEDSYVVGIDVALSAKKIVPRDQWMSSGCPEDFVPHAVQFDFVDTQELALVSYDGSVTLVEEATHDMVVDELASHSFTTYKTPDLIPLCFFFTEQI